MIPLLLIVASSVASAQDADAGEDDVMFGVRLSLEMVSLGLDATIPTVGGAEAVNISHSGTGGLIGIEYVLLTTEGIPLQRSLGLFFQAPFVDGDLTSHSFYAPMTVGSWIDLGPRFRINASLLVAFSHVSVQSDSLAWRYRQSSLSVGPLVGLSFLISKAKAEHRIELSGGASHHPLKSVIYHDGFGLIEIDAESPLFETPTLRLSYLALLP